MKRLLALLIVWTLLVVTGTLVSADGQTRNNFLISTNCIEQTEGNDGIR